MVGLVLDQNGKTIRTDGNQGHEEEGIQDFTRLIEQVGAETLNWKIEVLLTKCFRCNRS
jgi:hypothetical protein